VHGILRLFFDGSIVKHYLYNLLTFQIVHNRLKENTFLVTRSENLTTWPSCRHFELQWVSFHQ